MCSAIPSVMIKYSAALSQIEAQMSPWVEIVIEWLFQIAFALYFMSVIHRYNKMKNSDDKLEK